MPRQLFILIILFFSGSLLFAQVTVDLTILNDTTGQAITVHLPAGGHYFTSNRVFLQPDADNKVRLEVAAEVPGFYYFFGNFNASMNERWVQLYLNPGEHYSVTIDAQAPEKALEISGPAAAYNNFLNSRSRGDVRFPWHESLLDVFLIDTDTVPENILKRLQAAEDKDIDDLNAVPDLNEVQKAYALTDIDLYYKFLFNRITFLHGVSSYDAEEIHFNAGWQEPYYALVSDSPISVYGLASRWHQRLLDLKLSIASRQRAEEVRSTLGAKESNEFYWAQQKLLYADTEREPGLAQLLSDLIRGYPYEPSTVASYEDFKALFPDSPFLVPLTTALNKAMANAKGEAETAQPTKYLDQTSYQLLAEVLAGSDAPLIYIDLWATWCGPCKHQFTKKEKLDAFLHAYDDKIKTVYISIDREDEADAAIEKVIRFYDLNGLHVRASESLREELFRRFGKGEKETMSIPRYLIATREGVIIDDDASRPEDWVTLRAELEAALTKY